MRLLPKDWVPYDPGKEYCGADRYPWLCKLIGRRILGIDLNTACYNHDQRYAVGGTEADRLRADRLFWSEQSALIRMATFKYSPRRYAALVFARRRYRVVRLIGRTCFNYRDKK